MLGLGSNSYSEQVGVIFLENTLNCRLVILFTEFSVNSESLKYTGTDLKKEKSAFLKGAVS